MPRVKLSFPNNSIFQTSLKVRIKDLNYGNHLGNDSVLSLVHESRVEFLNSIGYTEFDVEGSSIIMADCVIEYKNQAFYNDTILISVYIDDLTNSGFDFYYHLINDNNSKTIAKVKTRIIFYDYENLKIQKTPEIFKQRIQSISSR